MVYTLRFFSSKCSLFHNSNVFGSVLFTFYIQGVLKLKKNNSGAKRLISCVGKIGVIGFGATLDSPALKQGMVLVVLVP